MPQFVLGAFQDVTLLGGKVFARTVDEELKTALYPIDVLLAGKSGSLTEEQKQALQTTRSALQRLGQAAEKVTPPLPTIQKKK